MSARCHRDGLPYRFDSETYADSLAAYGPALAIHRWRCPMGHEWPLPVDGASVSQRPVTRGRTGTRPCVVCAAPIAIKPTGLTVRTCNASCAAFVAKDRVAAKHAGHRYRMEEQPWYQGPETIALMPPPVYAPPAPIIIPRAWLDGWTRCYAPAPEETHA